MMPIELYIALLVACSCIFVLTVSFLLAAVYFKTRMSEMESTIGRIDGGLSGLIHESQGFVSKMQQLAVRGNGVMVDVGQMTHTAREWTDRAERLADAFTVATEPSMQRMSEKFKFGAGFLSGVVQALRAPNTKRSFTTRSIDMSECNNASSTHQNKGSSAPGIMAAFTAGALAGAGVAILFAPQSGKETRDKVASKTHDLKDRADDAVERGKRIVNEVKHEAHDAFERGKEIAHETSAA